MTPGFPTSADLAGRLRELARELHAGEVGADERVAALGHLDAALELLAAGAPRRRWYEVDSGDAAETRARNRELSTYSGSVNAVAPPMTIEPGELADGSRALIGRVRLDRLREGPPRAVHGGVVAGLFDELLGGGQRLGGGPPGVTGRLTVRYRRPTPLDEDLELRVWIHDERTRRVVVRGDCRVVSGDLSAGDREDRHLVTAEAEGIFLRVDFEGMEARLRDRERGAPSRTAPIFGGEP